VAQLDLVAGHTQGVGDDLREGGVVTLAVGVGAGPDIDRPGRHHPHLRRFDEADAAGGGGRRRRRSEAADLDPGRDPDPDVLALLAALLLLLADLVVADQLEGLVE